MQVVLEFKGSTGLVMHNARLVDKYDPITRQIALLTDKKTNRTEADDVEIGRLEFMGGLYHDRELGVYVPAANVVRCMQNAAKITRDGTKLLRGLAVMTDKVQLTYPGPREPQALYEKPEHSLRVPVGIDRKKIMRVRPIFPQWSLIFEAEMAEDILDLTQLVAIAERAGRSEGLGDARILGYGRFQVTVVSDLSRAEVLSGAKLNGRSLSPVPA